MDWITCAISWSVKNELSISQGSWDQEIVNLTREVVDLNEQIEVLQQNVTNTTHIYSGNKGTLTYNTKSSVVFSEEPPKSRGYY